MNIVGFTGLLLVLSMGVTLQGVSGNYDLGLLANEAEEDKCDKYWYVKDILTRCRNSSYGDILEVDYILQETENMCSNVESIKTCAEEKLGDCSNWNFIKAELDSSLGNCVNGDIPPTLKEFLTQNSGEYVSRKCIGSMLHETRTESAKNVCPKREMGSMVSPQTLADKVEEDEKYYSWYMSCFRALRFDLDEKPKYCCKKTRRQVYGIMYASLLAKPGFGFMHYHEFENLISISQNMVARNFKLQLTRDLFDWNI